jgi:hypothetical protein
VASTVGSGAAAGAGALGSAAGAVGSGLAGARSALGSAAGGIGSALGSAGSALGSGASSALGGLESAGSSALSGAEGLFGSGGGGSVGTALPEGISGAGPTSALSSGESALMSPSFSAMGGATPGASAGGSAADSFAAQGASSPSIGAPEGGGLQSILDPMKAISGLLQPLTQLMGGGQSQGGGAGPQMNPIAKQLMQANFPARTSFMRPYQQQA